MFQLWKIMLFGFLKIQLIQNETYRSDGQQYLYRYVLSW